MQNTSNRQPDINNIRIIISDAISDKIIGDARMASFDNIWLELPEATGRYTLKKRAINELKKHCIKDLDELFSKAWLVDNGEWILKNIERVKK